MKKSQNKIIICLVAAVAISGCQTTPEFKEDTNHPYYLDTQTIVSSENYDDLFDKWITQSIKENAMGVVFFGSTQKRTEATDLIKFGFSRYCTFTESEMTEEPITSGLLYSCKDISGNKVGIGYKRFGNDMLSVFSSTPQTRKEVVEKEKKELIRAQEIESLLVQNGPSGTIHMNDGSSVEFLRLGTGRKRELAHVKIKDPDNDNKDTYIFIDKIKRIDVKKKMFTLKSTGKSEKFDSLGVTEESCIMNCRSSGLGIDGLSFVVKGELGQPHTINIRYVYEKISSLEFDESELEGGLLKLNFSIQPYQDRLKKHFQSQVNELMNERDWSMYIDFNNLPEPVMADMRKTMSYLYKNGYSHSSNYLDGFEDGINFEALCQLAFAERAYLSGGYKITNESSPLFMFTLMSKIKRDITGKPATSRIGALSTYGWLKRYVKRLEL